MVRLTPPILNRQTVLKQLTGTRPMREGRFNISTTIFSGSKRIIHCYGMGGSGWTTLFGSVAKAIRLMELSDPDRQTAIRVVGSGCMGLTAAIELSKVGYKVAGITTEEIYDIPSWRAAGFFALVSIKTSLEEEQNLQEIGLETFETVKSIDKGHHPYISRDCVRLMPVYCSEKTEVGIESLEAKGYLPAPEPVTLDFGKGVKHPHYLRHTTYFLNTAKIMQQLTAEVNRLGIPIKIGRVSSFDQVHESIIFNCSGLGSRELNQDDRLIPVRGHLVSLNDRAGVDHMDYMIYTDVQQDGKDETIYMFPKDLEVLVEEPQGIPCRAILGGTFVSHADRLPQEQLAELDRQEFQRLLDRNSLFFHGTLFPK